MAAPGQVPPTRKWHSSGEEVEREFAAAQVQDLVRDVGRGSLEKTTTHRPLAAAGVLPGFPSG